MLRYLTYYGDVKNAMIIAEKLSQATPNIAALIRYYGEKRKWCLVRMPVAPSGSPQGT
jgi:hypothetical protein